VAFSPSVDRSNRSKGVTTRTASKGKSAFASESRPSRATPRSSRPRDNSSRFDD